MNTAIQETINHWGHLLAYTHIPHNENEYNKLLDFVDELMEISRHKKDERVTSLLRLVAQNIEAYESRRYLTKSLSPIEMLAYLMGEHGLGQGDLPEIGSQSLVSKILSGERKLTVEHIRKLAKRFAVSLSVFVE
jgi:HTH-type transcriptional regulator/antitoxin HigA